MTVSFKLETDEALLLNKASAAVEAYGVHVVVANLLQTRKDRVYVVVGVKTEGEDGKHAKTRVIQQIDRPQGEAVIERALVAEVVRAHTTHIGQEA